MKRLFPVLIGPLVLIGLLAGIAMTSLAANPLRVDVLFMDHGPMQPTLKQMRATFADFGDSLRVSWHDAESQAGAGFMAKMGVKGHVPLQIWLNGKDTVAVGDKPIRFVGFPTGAGPAFFQGKWTMDDLRQAIRALAAR